MRTRLLKLALCAAALLPLGAWADDVVVSSHTTWTFPASGDAITVVTAQKTGDDDNGLYYRAGAATGRSISFGSGAKLTWTYADGHTITTTNSTGNVLLLANGNLRPACSSASEGLGTALTGDADNRALAFTTGVPGIVYIANRAGGSTADRYYKLFFKPNGESTYGDPVAQELASTVSSATDKKGTIYYAAYKGGTFVFGGGEKQNVYAIEFVPFFSTVTTTNGAYSVVSAAKAATPADGETVTLAVTPNAGYWMPTTMTVTDSDGSNVAVTNNGDGTYTFTTTKFPVTVSATCPAVDPVGEWNFQTLVYNNNNYITESSQVCNLERNSNNVLTGRIAKGTSSEYYVNPLTLSGVFGNSDGNLRIRKHTDNKACGLFVYNNTNSDLTIYNLKAGNSISFALNTSNSSALSVPSGKLKNAATGEAVTAVASGVNYIVQADGNLTITITKDGTNHVHINNITIGNTYKVSYTDETDEGTVEIAGANDLNNVIPGTNLTITATPKPGYALQSVSVKDADEGDITVTDNTFTMPAKDVTVTATFLDVRAVNPIGTWDFQTWAKGTDYITDGEALYDLQRGTIDILTGKIKKSGSDAYYDNALPLNNVFSASANVKIRKNNSTASNGLIIEGGKSATLVVYNMKNNDEITITWASTSSNPISFPTETMKASGSSDWATTATSGTTYILQKDVNLELAIATESGKPVHINKIVVGGKISGIISASGWNTLSSSSKLDLSTVSGGTAYVATSTAGSNVTLTPVTDKVVEAGEGLMIKGTAGESFTVSTTDASVTYEGTNLLKGLPFGGKVTANANNYVFGWADSASPGFYYINATEPTLDAGKAYLHTETALAARMAIVFDDETTGVDNLKSQESVDKSLYFDLQGRRVAQPTKGLYIVNGKKVIIK